MAVARRAPTRAKHSATSKTVPLLFTKKTKTKSKSESDGREREREKGLWGGRECGDSHYLHEKESKDTQKKEEECTCRKEEGKRGDKGDCYMFCGRVAAPCTFFFFPFFFPFSVLFSPFSGFFGRSFLALFRYVRKICVLLDMVRERRMMMEKRSRDIIFCLLFLFFLPFLFFFFASLLLCTEVEEKEEEKERIKKLHFTSFNYFIFYFAFGTCEVALSAK